MSSPPRQAVIVLGMHRSGTSALTGTLARLGFALPRTPMADARDNPEGFYESQRIVDENFEILRAQGCAWNVTFTIEPRALAASAPPQQAAALQTILADEYPGSGDFVLKDPRLCLLLPLWFAGIKRLAPRHAALLLVRHPAEVMHSLTLRNGRPVDESALNWLHHMLEAEHISRGMPRAVLLYEDLLRDWQAALGPALRSTGITPPRSLLDAAPEISRFIAPQLRHHHVDQAQARIGPAYLAPLIDTSWRALRMLTHNPRDEFALALLDDARANLTLIRHDIIRQGLRPTLPAGL